MRDDLRLHGLVGGAAAEKNFLMKYVASDTIVDLKGNPIQVAVGDYVYNEFNYTKVDGGSVTIDRTSTTQVVNAAHATTGNGGRKIVRLDNGWLITAVRATSNTQVFKSEDNGLTWSLLYTTPGNIGDRGIALATRNNAIYLLCGTYGGINSAKFDLLCFVITTAGAATWVSIEPSGVQTDGYDVSLTVGGNGHIHASWVSKNATYPNSFNLRYSKSTDNGVTWEAPTQITTYNTTGVDCTNTCVVCTTTNLPRILFKRYASASDQGILVAIYNGSSWTATTQVYAGGSYSLGQPSATVDASGVIHVVWHGTDATDNSYFNIRYSKSTDNGATWSAMEKVTSGNTTSRQHASIACDANGIPYVAYYYSTNLVLVSKSGSWSAESILSSSSAVHPSLCDNYRSFEKPLMVWKNGSTDVKFYGKWTNVIEQIIPPMSLATSKTQLQAIYANTLKMHNPTADARYQGFVSKKDLWTTALQELDWVAASISRAKNLFGLQGASPDKLFATGTYAWSTTSSPSTHTFNVTGLSFVPKLMLVLPYGENQQNQYGNHAIYTKGIIGSEDLPHNGETGNGAQPYPSIHTVTSNGFTISILGSSGYALNGTARWIAIG